MALTFSVIINTYNRAASLERTLQSLRQLDYPDFEVIVVNGPSTDETAKLLERWASEVKVGHCAAANLSASRNIGIAMAAGDVVTFIDDDAMPEPEWLQGLAAGYTSPEVGGVGGWVYDHTGARYQSQYIICDRFGDATIFSGPNPTEHFNFPLAYQYCSHLGTNSSFRRDVMLEIGGFDEEYEYYLDETDVCVRMVDAGWVVKFVGNALVHHKFLPSGVRNEHRVVKNWYPILKNKTYFARRNAARTHSGPDIKRNVEHFVADRRRHVEYAVHAGLLPAPELDAYDRTADRAVRDGIERSRAPARKLITAELLERLEAPVKPFRGMLAPPGERLTIVQALDAPVPEGELPAAALALAARGHIVHVIARGTGHDTVDLDRGVWVHRLATGWLPGRWLAEVGQIAYRRPIDIVHACSTSLLDGEVSARGLARAFVTGPLAGDVPEQVALAWYTTALSTRSPASDAAGPQGRYPRPMVAS